MLKASAEASVAIKASPFEADSTHCPFYARFGVPIFEYYEKYPENSGRFARAMAGWRKGEYLLEFDFIAQLLLNMRSQGRDDADMRPRSGK